MFSKLFLESKKPKDFYIHRPRPNSKKWEYTKNKPDDGYLISVDEETYSIKANDDAMVYIYAGYNEWNTTYWEDGLNEFGSKAVKKIQEMIKYIKELN